MLRLRTAPPFPALAVVGGALSRPCFSQGVGAAPVPTLIESSDIKVSNNEASVDLGLQPMARSVPEGLSQR